MSILECAVLIANMEILDRYDSYKEKLSGVLNDFEECRRESRALLVWAAVGGGLEASGSVGEAKATSPFLELW